MIASLENALGIGGVLLMPSFNLIGDREQRAGSWDIAKTESSVGWLTEYFRLMPGTHRSDHYSHSVAARGQGAKKFVADHLSEEGMTSPWDHLPWGKTYGTNSPMMRAYDSNGKISMLGVDYQSSTYIHVVEVMLWNERLKETPMRNTSGSTAFDSVKSGIGQAFWRPAKLGTPRAACSEFARMLTSCSILSETTPIPTIASNWIRNRRSHN